MDVSSDAGAHARLLLARQAAKYTTLKEAADAAGVSRHALSRWEQGRGSPGFEELRRLCELYGVTPNYIVVGTDVSGVYAQAIATARLQPRRA